MSNDRQYTERSALSLPSNSLEGLEDLSTRPPLDIDAYRHHLESLHLMPEQETELLRTLCSIMVAFVELGWGLDPAQSILGAIAKKAWDAEPETVNQNEGLTLVFNQTTESSQERNST